MYQLQIATIMSTEFKNIYANLKTEKLIDIIENPMLHGDAQVKAAQFELSKRNVSPDEMMRMKMMQSLKKGIKTSAIQSKTSNGVTSESKGIWGFIKSIIQ